DEPFSGLDPVNQQVMEEMMRDMARRQRTVIFSTHVMQHAERLCDRILLITKGRKIFDGTVGEARAVMPRRVRVEAEGDIEQLRELPEVLSITAAPQADSSRAGEAGEAALTRQWELHIRERAD